MLILFYFIYFSMAAVALAEPLIAVQFTVHISFMRRFTAHDVTFRSQR